MRFFDRQLLIANPFFYGKQFLLIGVPASWRAERRVANSDNLIQIMLAEGMGIVGRKFIN